MLEYILNGHSLHFCISNPTIPRWGREFMEIADYARSQYNIHRGFEHGKHESDFCIIAFFWFINNTLDLKNLHDMITLL